jgi:hypothetical protein
MTVAPSGSPTCSDPSQAPASPAGAERVWNPFDQGGRDNFPSWSEVLAPPSGSSGSSEGSHQPQLDVEALSRRHPVDIPLVFPPGYGSAPTGPQLADRWFDAEAARKAAQVRGGALFCPGVQLWLRRGV